MRFDEFLHYAEDATLVPVYRELAADTLTPVGAFLRLRGDRSAPSGASFLLESVEGGERLGRYSFLGRDPFLSFTASADRITLKSRDGVPEERRGNLFDVLEETLAPFRSAIVPRLPPLTGGAVGYLSYDTIRAIERIPDRHPRETDLPDCELYFHDTIVAFDHAKHRLILIANAHVEAGMRPERLRAEYDRSLERLDSLQAALSSSIDETADLRSLEPLPPCSVDRGMQANFTREEYEAVVEKAREFIFAGDIFQVVLSQRFQKRTDVDPFEVYRCLRSLNPSPYLFYHEWGETALIGSSPEIMVRTLGRRTLVRPIAGTRPRGTDESEDRALEDELLADEKELAEHRMLVDLGRNDVGRVAQFGSVDVLKLEVVERYSHVMHIVSEVVGELRPEHSVVDSFKACFPAGTLSGAPKIRAMEIIDELEHSRRGTYAGAVGYIDFAGNMDTCIAIRTLQIHRGVATVQAGAGIVADSVPAREYEECIHKASAVFEAIRHAEALAKRGSPDTGDSDAADPGEEEAGR